jgi:hypothetical protein
MTGMHGCIRAIISFASVVTMANDCSQCTCPSFQTPAKANRFPSDEYARVVGIDDTHNRITVVLKDGTELTYAPHRQQGVSV